jgi:tetratricopeptide (TPR) repeat protein
MKTLIMLILFLGTISITKAQKTVKEYLSSATMKHAMQDLKGAIEEYSQVLSLDSTKIEAFVGRGTCHMNLGNQQEARADFLRYLDKDPMNLDIYYSIAITYLSENNHAGALPHLDKAIQLNPDYPPNRTMRGQILSYLGYTVSGCEDFLHAMNTGDKEGAELYQKYCVNSWGSNEGYALTWPEDIWFMQSTAQDSTYRLVEYLKKNENPDTWTEYGAMLSVKGFDDKTTLNDFILNVRDEFRNRAPKASMRIIEKSTKGEKPWIIVAMEAPITTNHKKPESQLWHIIMGKGIIYGNFRAVKEKKLSKKQIQEWSSFFKTGKLIEK